MDDLPPIHTGRYYSRPLRAKVKAGELVPVRVTAGFPRGITYELVESLPGLTPDRAMLHLEETPFRKVFRLKMERCWSDTLTEFGAIAARHAGLALALLCFEDLNKEGVWCHRTIVAEFITEKTEIAVTELEG